MKFFPMFLKFEMVRQAHHHELSCLHPEHRRRKVKNFVLSGTSVSEPVERYGDDDDRTGNNLLDPVGITSLRAA